MWRGAARATAEHARHATAGIWTDAPHGASAVLPANPSKCPTQSPQRLPEPRAFPQAAAVDVFSTLRMGPFGGPRCSGGPEVGRGRVNTRVADERRPGRAAPRAGGHPASIPAQPTSCSHATLDARESTGDDGAWGTSGVAWECMPSCWDAAAAAPPRRAAGGAAPRGAAGPS